MNILVIAPFVPYPLDQGGKIRIFNLVQQLSGRHRVTLACLSTESAPELGPLRDCCEELIVVRRTPSFARDFSRFLLAGQAFNCSRFSSDSFAQALESLAGRRSFDLVQIEFSMLWQYASLFPAVPVTLDAHNIEYRNVSEIGSAAGGMKRWLYRLEARRLQRDEERAWRESALCFAVSEREREAIAARVNDGAKVVTAANGVDPERFAFKPRDAAKTVLFLGGMDYSPNLDAARFFLEEIFPLIRREEPEARLLLVGRGLGALGRLAAADGVSRHESVPDVLPWFYRAGLLAVPLRQGAGTRIKVLEAMAAGLPVVATAKGCEGIAAGDGRELLVADTAREFACAALRVMRDSHLATTLALNARSLVLERYTWKSSAAIMAQGMEQCTAHSKDLT